MKLDEQVLMQKIKRFYKLRDTIILIYSKDLDYDGDRDFIITDALFVHLVNGDINDYYESSLLVGMSDFERNNILNVVNKYAYLLFYNKNASNWFQSIDMDLVIYEPIALKLLDYYDFLIELYIKGGEKALQELSKYSDYDVFQRTSVVDFLMSAFTSSEILEKVILDFSIEDGIYKDFSVDQRACLLEYPKGTLYYEDNNGISYVSVDKLLDEINSRDGDFKSIIYEISGDYLLSSNFDEK